MTDKTIEELDDFGGDCMDLAQERGFTPAECVSAMLNAAAMLSTMAVRPGFESEMLDVLISGLQEAFALCLKHRSAVA